MDDSNPLPPASPPSPPRGRPRNPDALTAAERSKQYRDRLKAEGFKEVKCYLSPAQVAYLIAVCRSHRVTIAEAVSLSLTALVRGDVLLRPGDVLPAMPGPAGGQSPAAHTGILLLNSA
jgi:hypothetical protein